MTTQLDFQRLAGYADIQDSFRNLSITNISSKELQELAQKAAIQHKWFYHFTSIDSLKKILKNRSSQDFFDFIYCVSRKLPRP